MSESNTQTAEAPSYSQFPIAGKQFRTTVRVIKPRKTKSGALTAEKKFVLFAPSSAQEAKDLLSILIDQVVATNKDSDAVVKFVGDILSDRCEEATNATLVKQADGSYVKKVENFLPELVNTAKAARGGGEKIKDLKERFATIMQDMLELREFRDKNNTDQLITANSVDPETGKPRYTTLAQVNTVLASWNMEYKALRARITEHEHRLAERAEKREKKAAEKKDEAAPAKA